MGTRTPDPQMSCDTWFLKSLMLYRLSYAGRCNCHTGPGPNAQLTTDIALRKINIIALPLQLHLLRYYT